MIHICVCVGDRGGGWRIARTGVQSREPCDRTPRQSGAQCCWSGRHRVVGGREVGRWHGAALTEMQHLPRPPPEGPAGIGRRRQPLLSRAQQNPAGTTCDRGSVNSIWGFSASPASSLGPSKPQSDFWQLCDRLIV